MKNVYFSLLFLLLTPFTTQAESSVSLQDILYKNCYTSYNEQYINFENHRAFTYAADSEGSTSCGWSYNQTDSEKAKEAAIISCEKNKVNSPCKFIDIDGEVVVGYDEFELLIHADEHKLTDKELMGMMEEAEHVISGNCLPFYKTYLTSMHGQRAFSYARDKKGNFACGMSGSGLSIIEPAIKQAIEQCEINRDKRGNNKPLSECRIYAMNYDVIAKPENFAVSIDTAQSFQKAVSEGDIDDVKIYLSQGTDINIKSKDGSTAIFIAAAKGNLALFNLLSKKGADLSVIHQDGSNLLMAAIAGKNINIIQILLEKEADINHTNKEGLTPLHLSVMSLEVPIMQLLMNHGADSDKLNMMGETPQDMAENLKLDLHKLNSQTTAENAVNENTIDINARDEDGWTALFWAAKDNNLGKIKAILNQGADINARDDFGSIALTYAINHENIDAIKLLVKKGSNINNKDTEGKTPLMDAAYKDNPDIIEFLLAQGADKSIADASGKRALHHLRSNASTEIKLLLALEL